MFLTDVVGSGPGITTARETYEREFRWGPHALGLYYNGRISGAARDSGSDPTFLLRPGLLLGQLTADGSFTTYSPTATDGSEVATGVMIESMRMEDFQGNNVNRVFAILVGGPVKAAKLINLDKQARQQMAGNFTFDDSDGVGYSIPGNHWFPWKRFQNKTANYTVVASDNFTMFDNAGAGGTVVLTLPAIANGYMFGLRCEANQVLRFTSAEGSNLIGSTTTQTSASVTAIGGVVWVYTNAAGTKWIVEQHGTQTITFA